MLDADAFEPMLTIFFMIFMIGLNIYFYSKKQIWVISLVILIGSIWIWIPALSVNLPLAPFVQNFFMLFQIVLFAFVSVKTLKG